jgi:hypothetical protein
MEVDEFGNPVPVMQYVCTGHTDRGFVAESKDATAPPKRHGESFDLLRSRVIEYLNANPGASKNAVHKAVGGRRSNVMDFIDLWRAGVGKDTEDAGGEATSAVSGSIQS